MEVENKSSNAKCGDEGKPYPGVMITLFELVSISTASSTLHSCAVPGYEEESEDFGEFARLLVWSFT